MARRERQRLRLVVDQRLLDVSGGLECSDAAVDIARHSFYLAVQDSCDH
jgi:hypothetical protein